MTRRAGDAGSGGRAAGLGFRTTAAERIPAESAPGGSGRETLGGADESSDAAKSSLRKDN